jgi:hypothetical protein
MFIPFANMASSGQSYDSDAQAFFNEVAAQSGTLSTDEKNAINTFYVDMKSNGLYTQMRNLYLFMGGNEASHAIDAKNPTTGDTLAYATTGNAWTHTNADGSAAVRTSGAVGPYARTGITPIDDLTLGDTHFSLYQTSTSTATQYNLAVQETGMIIGYGNTSFYALFDRTSYAPYSAPSNQGFYIANSNGTNVQNGWRNGSKVIDTTLTNSWYASSAGDLVLNAKGTSITTQTEYCTATYTFMSVGDGLTDADAGTFTTLVNTLQTSLSRNTYS